MKKTGRKIKNMSFGADSEVVKAIEDQAKETDRTLAYVIKDILKRYYKLGRYAQTEGTK